MPEDKKKDEEKKEGDFAKLFATMSEHINFRAMAVLLVLFFILNTTIFVDNVLARIPGAVTGGSTSLYGLGILLIIFAIFYMMAHVLLADA